MYAFRVTSSLLTLNKVVRFQWCRYNLLCYSYSKLGLQAQASCLDEHAFWRGQHFLHSRRRLWYP